MAHKVKSPENQPQFSPDDNGAVLVSPNKLSDQPEVATEFFKTLFKGIFY